MLTRKGFYAILVLCLFLSFCSSEKAESVSADTAKTQAQAQGEDDLKEWNNQIRLEKFDIVLPLAMRKNNVDMWIHIMREAIRDPFGA